jgi:hypothetical protein
MGCAQSAAAGGSCKSGAAAGFVSAAGSPFINGNYVTKLIANSVMGAISSKLGGGKAENGAITGAFGYLFNEWDDLTGKGPNDRGRRAEDIAADLLRGAGYQIVGQQM